MIESFRCKDTEALFLGRRVARFANIEKAAMRKLQMLHAATRIETLRIPPQNRLEKLRGERAGQWSMRINDQWRICFVWKEASAWNVEIVNYH